MVLDITISLSSPSVTAEHTINSMYVRYSLMDCAVPPKDFPMVDKFLSRATLDAQDSRLETYT